jgi:hypothetical protein
MHHPLWGGLNRGETDPEAEDLIDIIGGFALYSTLPPGTVTFEESRTQSAIDLCHVTTGLIDRVIKSEVDRSLYHDSDHLPISTALDLTVQRLEKKPRKAWKRLDEKAYIKVLRQSLPSLRRPITKTALDTYTDEVAAAVQNAISKAVPETYASCHSREGWTEERAAVLAETKRLKRIHSRHHTGETWEAYRAARNHKARTVSKALRKAHRDRIERAAESPEALWKLAKWARTRHNQSARTTPAIRHPDTQQELMEPADKASQTRQSQLRGTQGVSSDSTA